jgi:DNA-binding CsgD family transcriptional regulator/tetratricopeptide (TPR) repeat protein
MEFAGQVNPLRAGRMAGRSQLGSVVVGRFSFAWLTTMLALAPVALLEPVSELIRSDLLVDDDGELGFRHDLLREAVLATLPPSTRRALKRQAARVLMTAGAPPLQVANLLVDGAEPGDREAVGVLLRAVSELGRHDPGTAADLGLRALEIASPDDPARGPLVAQTALLLYAADRADEGQRFADAALGTLLPAEQQAEIRLSVAQMYSVPADVRVANGRAALGLEGISVTLRARHLAWLSHNLLGVGNVGEAARRAGEAEAAVLASGDDRAISRLAVVGATLDFVDGRYASALERLDRVPGVALGGGFDPALEVQRSETLAALGRLDAALAVVQEALGPAQRDRHAYEIRTWEQYRGRRLVELGRLDDAAAALEGALAPDGSLPVVHGADAPAVVALGRVAIHIADDRLGRACRALALTLLDASAPEVRRHAAWLLLLQAMARSDFADARAILERLGEDALVSVLPQIRFDPTDDPQLVRLALALGNEPLADAAVRAADRRARLNPEVPMLGATAAHARGLRDDDLEALVTAVHSFQEASRPLALASALEDLGRAQVRTDMRDLGVSSLGRALEIYVDAGATWDGARVRGRLRALGIRRRLARPTRPANGWAGLTDSELTIARLVAEGLTNRDVADRMFLSPHTVSMHLRHAFSKLNINSRVELTTIVRAHEEQDTSSVQTLGRVGP